MKTKALIVIESACKAFVLVLACFFILAALNLAFAVISPAIAFWGAVVVAGLIGLLGMALIIEETLLDLNVIK